MGQQGGFDLSTVRDVATTSQQPAAEHDNDNSLFHRVMGHVGQTWANIVHGKATLGECAEGTLELAAVAGAAAVAWEAVLPGLTISAEAGATAAAATTEAAEVSAGVAGTAAEDCGLARFTDLPKLKQRLDALDKLKRIRSNPFTELTDWEEERRLSSLVEGK